MISIEFAGKIVMAMHIVTIEMRGLEDGTGSFLISLSNGLVLEEKFATEEEKIAVAKKLAFDGSGNQNGSAN